FLTQKLSWNRFTAPPHHSFHWRGIDGTTVLTHFPPADTYTGSCEIAELRYQGANYKDADRTAEALYLFGFGDGGGGPTPEMIERLSRVGDLLGVPATKIRTPEEFFERLERDAAKLGAVEGELYFEYHRGTYTSQAEVKRLNRRCEDALQTLEWLAATATSEGLEAPSRGDVERLWRVLLTNQFHDILPGSSIAEVYRRAVPELHALEQEVVEVSERLMASLAPGAAASPIPVNPTGHVRSEVCEDPSGELRFVCCPAFSAGRVDVCTEEARVSDLGEHGLALSNRSLRAVVSRSGDLVRLTHLSSGREAVCGEGGRLLLLDDRPTAHEAWDIDPFALETAREGPPAHAVRIVRSGPLRAEIAIERRIGAASRLTQSLRLDAASGQLVFDNLLDWRERRTLLKAVFETPLLARRANFETAFGVVERPTAASTDAEAAQYEVPGHRWADLSEPGFGLSLLSDARYGFSAFEGTIGLSLARGPLSPDPSADLGEHRFAFALVPHAGGWREAGT
ncbi:MAG: alpha-mannosidase, partial [Caulobacteraceae bacterium]